MRGGMAILPVDQAPFYHQRAFWKAVVEAKEPAQRMPDVLPNTLNQKLWWRDAELGNTNMVNYWEDICCCKSSPSPKRPEEKASGCGMESAD